MISLWCQKLKKCHIDMTEMKYSCPTKTILLVQESHILVFILIYYQITIYLPLHKVQCIYGLVVCVPPKDFLIYFQTIQRIVPSFNSPFFSIQERLLYQYDPQGNLQGECSLQLIQCTLQYFPTPFQCTYQDYPVQFFQSDLTLGTYAILIVTVVWQIS